MVFIRDVWVNWFEGEENGYNVCPFHEWRTDDQVEVLDQAKLILVSPCLFDYIENHLAELPDDLLAAAYRQSYLRKNMKRIQLEYCFVATDRKRVIAVDTIGYKTPIRKSRLTPKQEAIALERLAQNKLQLFHIENLAEKEYHILSPHPNDLLGLTRKERQLKQLLYMALDQLYATGSDAEVRYWYTEWCPQQYIRIQMLSREKAWEELFNGVKKGWSKKHYRFCETIVKGQAFFEKLWELEHGESVK